MLIYFKPYNLYEGVTMILRKSFIIFSLMLVTATTVYAEKVESLYNPQVIEQHYITNEDISLATASTCAVIGNMSTGWTSFSS